MERVKGFALYEGLAIQATWVLLAWLMALSLWRAGVRRYQAVGG
jgi:ABC-type uncharacterized transport system permease subunit